MTIKCKRRVRGVATIEFAIGFIFFWYMCVAWAEMSFMSYISAVGDLAISHSAQVAKTYSGTGDEDEVKNKFLEIFQTELESNDSLWRYVARANDFKLTVQYIDTYEKLTQVTPPCLPEDDEQTKSCGIALNSAIAIYRISYNYTPIFNFFLYGDQLFSREMIVIQEYQRAKVPV
jgi:tight adherence protein E